MNWQWALSQILVEMKSIMGIVALIGAMLLWVHVKIWDGFLDSKIDVKIVKLFQTWE